MTKVIKQMFVLMWLPVLLVSCIRDELPPCPPLSLHVGVADYNYSNAGNFADEPIKPEQAPLSTYVKSVAWHIVDVQTGRVVAEQHVFQLQTPHAKPPSTCRPTCLLANMP